MKINIVSVEPEELSQPSIQLAAPKTVVSSSANELELVFAQFLVLEVGDGAASSDTIRSYLSQSKQYFA